MDYSYTKEQWVEWHEQKRKLMEEAYTEVTPEDFYRDLFPEGSLQIRGDMESDKGNAMVDIITYYPNDKRFSRKYIMTDDLDALKYIKPGKRTKEVGRMCLCSPVSYYGKHKSNAMAHELYAVVLDLDYVGVQQLKNVMKQIENGARCIPPNYIVNSGRGLHLYYLLEEPIPCYAYMIEQLSKFKAALQNFTWNETSSLNPDKPDHGAITQAFRMVGSETKLGKEYVARAYKVRDERWTVEALYDWVYTRAKLWLEDCPMPKFREPIKVYREKHPLTMKEAREKYPNWNPNSKSKKWSCHEGLYHWWINQIKKKAVVGGRYYAVLALAAYGSKCDIPFEQIEKDALDLVPYLESLTNDETNHFTKADAMDALTFYKNNRKEVTYKLTRDKISELSKINITPNKRRKKPLKRDDGTAFKAARMIQNLQDPDGEWRYKGGAPEKKEIVMKYRQEHPDARKADCIRDTGLSKPTVYKWWDAQSDLASVVKVDIKAEIVKPDGTRIPVPFSSKKQK